MDVPRGPEQHPAAHGDALWQYGWMTAASRFSECPKDQPSSVTTTQAGAHAAQVDHAAFGEQHAHSREA
jgi:hypothetical protein